MSSHQRNRKIAVRERLTKMSTNPNRVYVVHYSGEDFKKPDTGGSPRIASIAVRNFDSGETKSFSIHMFAELEHVSSRDIASRYNDLEKRMLESFYEYVREHKDADWVHWNMRDINYGFVALEHRLSVLGGKPIEIEEQSKFDLSRALVTLYGESYAQHHRMPSLMALNDMTTNDFLSGQQEAEAFREGRYVALHRSTLRKVHTFCYFLEGAIDRTLKTDARWRDKYDLHLVSSAVKDHWIGVILGLVATVITILLAVLNLIPWL